MTKQGIREYYFRFYVGYAGRYVVRRIWGTDRESARQKIADQLGVKIEYVRDQKAVR